jgi:hypothetical protein
MGNNGAKIYIGMQPWLLPIASVHTHGSLNDGHSNYISAILENDMNQDNKGQPQQGGQSNKPGQPSQNPGQQTQQPGQSPGQQTQQPAEKPGQTGQKS